MANVVLYCKCHAASVLAACLKLKPKPKHLVVCTTVCLVFFFKKYKPKNVMLPDTSRMNKNYIKSNTIPSGAFWTRQRAQYVAALSDGITTNAGKDMLEIILNSFVIKLEVHA